jgi:hypothetical protein
MMLGKREEESSDVLRASPVTSCTCICIRERKMGSIRDAKQMHVSRPVMPASWHVLSAGESAAGLSYLTSTLNGGRLIQITNYLHKWTLCKEGINSCFNFHPKLTLTGTIGPHSWICTCIADEKVQMQMRIQDHWACPNCL